MKLGVLTALWKRPRISSVVLDHYPGFGVCVAANSPGSGIRAKSPWHEVMAPNLPLSDKWNAGLEEMRKHSPDAVMIVGSDDLISRGYVLDALEEIEKGAGLVLLRGLYVYCSETGRAVRLVLGRMGAGRMLSREVLDRLNWKLWPPGLNSRLDRGMDQTILIRPTFRSVTLDDGEGRNGDRICLEIKSETNIWSFESLASSPSAKQANGVFKHFPEAGRRIKQMREPKHVGGGWYELPTGEKVQGKEAAQKAVEAQEADEGQKVVLTATVNIPAHRSPTGYRIPKGTEFEADRFQARSLRGWTK